MTYVIISGGIDLSVGSIVALTGVVTTQMYGNDTPLILAVICGLLVGLVFGLFNGFLVTVVNINPLITTLGTMSIARGLAFVLSGGATNSIRDELFGKFGRGYLSIFSYDIPIAFIVLIVLFLMGHMILKYSIYGRIIYAIGGNAEASRLAGIRLKRSQLSVYVLSGLFSSIAGLLLTSQLAAGAPQAASGLELSVIAAVIL